MKLKDIRRVSELCADSRAAGEGFGVRGPDSVF